MVQYAATHKRLLSKTQVDEFVGNLQAAALSGDTEKAVEQAINSLLAHGLHALHKNADINRSYIHNTDGYITVDNIDTPYALLVEAKRDLELSTSKHDRAVVYAQVCWYLRDLIRAGVRRPSVVVVCDNNEVFALPTTVLVGYAVDDGWPWGDYAASTMYQHKPLVNKLELDADIQHPYVHDIAVGFDADMFIRAVDALGQGSAPERVSVTEGALDHVFTRFKMEVLGTDAVGLKNKQEIVLFVDILKGSEDIYAHPKKANTLVWGGKQVTLDTYRYEQFWSQYKIGQYTLAELKEITAIADKLLEETDRRFSGDFWTPPRWVDKAHEYIEKDLGEDWKNKYVVIDPACYDDQTEVYTQRGWVLFKDLFDDDLIYSLNPFTLQGEWVGFVDRQVIPYDGTLLYIKSLRVDLAVTPDHKMFNAEKPYIKKGGDVFPTRHFFWSAHDTAEYLRRGNRLRQVSAATCSGNKEASTNRELNLARLMGLHIGDGFIQRNGSNNAVNSLVFTFAKQRKQDYLEKLIEALDIDCFTYDEKPHNPAHSMRRRYRLVSKWLLAEMEWFHDKKTYTKSFPPGVFDWPEDRKRALLEGLLESDGHKIKGGNLFVYSTVSPQLAHDIERLAIELGYTTKQTSRRREYKGKVTRRQYEISLVDKSPYKTVQKKHVSERAYKGFVYDVTLEKNHILLVRRNGRSIFSGNCGTLNLTRDYLFSELYSSTLFQEELDIASDYNPEATKFQYDFLNDDIQLHEDGMTADKALELARSGKLKLPLELVEALAANKPVVFFTNPPYGQSGSGQGRGHKAGVNNTAVGELMDGLGHARMELYTQFIWRTKELAKIFNYTSDFHFFFFTSAKFISSPNFIKFVDDLTSDFTYCDGFMMNAGEFNGTSSAWGIVFSHYEINGANQCEFDYTVLEQDKGMLINKLADWQGRLVQKNQTINNWSKIDQKRDDWDKFAPITKNGYDAPDQKNTRCRVFKPWFGYFVQDGTNVQGSEKYTGLYTMGLKRGYGVSVHKHNFTRAIVTFSIRRAVYEKFAENKQLWFHWEDSFTAPSESLITDEFITDCVVYSLFDRKANQTSLRNYEYQDKTYRIINEFFPWSSKSVLKLAQEHHNRTIEADITGDKERYVYQWLRDHSNSLSAEARAVLALAWYLVEVSFAKREMFAQLKPRYQVESWDAGWKQINAMIFGRDRIDDEIYDEYYGQWKSVIRRLGNKIADLAQKDGIIMYKIGPIIIDPRKAEKVDTGFLDMNNKITVSDFVYAVADKFESRKDLVTSFNVGSFIITEKDREFLSGGNGSGIVLDYDDPNGSLNDLLIEYENEIHKVLTNKTKFDSIYGDVDAIINSDTFIVTKKLKELITECMSLNDMVDLVYFACTDVNGFKEKYC